MKGLSWQFEVVRVLNQILQTFLATINDFHLWEVRLQLE